MGGRTGGCALTLAGVGVLLGWLLVLAALQPLQQGFWGTGLGALLTAQRVSLLVAVSSLGVYHSYLRQWGGEGLAFEFVGGGVFLAFSWYALFTAQTLPALLLWLEVVTLLAALLVTVVTLIGGDHSQTTSAWPSLQGGRSSQLGLLLSLIVFLWLSGMATLAFLWGLSSVAGGGSLGSGVGAQGLGEGLNPLACSPRWAAVLVFAGLVCKLAIQPIHVALFMFYRGLSLAALCLYVVVYYVVMVFFFFSYLMPMLSQLGVLWAPAGIIVLGCGLVSVACLTTTGGGLRQVLMFSTLYNLSLLLAASCCG